MQSMCRNLCFISSCVVARHPHKHRLIRMALSTSSSQHPTAAALIIGNEILSGKVRDTNTSYLASLLFSRGIILKRVEIIPDHLPTISESVLKLSSTHTYLFTSGGIGSTLDDITYQSIAHAFNLQLLPNQSIINQMKLLSTNTNPINNARLRMATIPSPCRLIFTPGLWVPICCVNENVFVLPGVPWIFEKMLEANKAEWGSEGGGKHVETLYTDVLEGDLAEDLERIEREFGPDVEIGSYPNVNRHKKELEYNVMVTLEGWDHDKVKRAAQRLRPLIHAKQTIEQ
mmetsp:Transcript_7152/g.12871  ORF Transcript_7152/g.12871 Transcript_7152/m.12871 type:complete len:287 (+) Transcript_7152:706-1566(+)